MKKSFIKKGFAEVRLADAKLAGIAPVSSSHIDRKVWFSATSTKGNYRWNENAGLLRNAISSQVIDALEAHEIRRLAMGSLALQHYAGEGSCMMDS
jgi:hypothetical protein